MAVATLWWQLRCGGYYGWFYYLVWSCFCGGGCIFWVVVVVCGGDMSWCPGFGQGDFIQRAHQNPPEPGRDQREGFHTHLWQAGWWWIAFPLRESGLLRPWPSKGAKKEEGHGAKTYFSAVRNITKFTFLGVAWPHKDFTKKQII